MEMMNWKLCFIISYVRILFVKKQNSIMNAACKILACTDGKLKEKPTWSVLVWSQATKSLQYNSNSIGGMNTISPKYIISFIHTTFI